jgi:Asp-tRNA(Asn)/Glu-tRNA(Gln) amidotransferase A subunit family amidase
VSARLWELSISEQTKAIESGVVPAEVLAEQTRAAIQRREPELKAWVQWSSDLAAQSRRVNDISAALPLRGISLGVKDLIDVAGLPTRAGSPVTSSAPAVADAACVARLRALGAVVQGKTVTTEFGYFSPGATRNPHAKDHSPGGSSSGSAAAVGAHTIPLALGTQTAGSLTRPASYCGAAGMVLAHDATSMAGIVGLSPSLDSLGLLTRTVEDLRLVYRAFTGHGSTAARAAPVDTVFVWHGSGLDDVSPLMCDVLQQIPVLINNLGIECRPLEFDDQIQTLTSDHLTVMGHEAAHTRAVELHDHGEALSAPLRQLLEDGIRTSADDHYAALVRRDQSREQLAALLGSNSVVVGPAALGPAPMGLAATGSPILSRPWQLLGLPVVVVPGARTAQGLPLGVQIIGLPGQEPQMLDFAAELERLLRGLRPAPQGSPP